MPICGHIPLFYFMTANKSKGQAYFSQAKNLPLKPLLLCMACSSIHQQNRFEQYYLSCAVLCFRTYHDQKATRPNERVALIFMETRLICGLYLVFIPAENGSFLLGFTHACFYKTLI